MIPNVVHFIFGMVKDFGGKPFSLPHWLAVKSAIEVNNVSRAIIHIDYEPDTYWWRKAIALPSVEVNKVTAPGEIFGRSLSHPAHRADVLRLELLIKYGGVYLDLDTLCALPWTHLLSHKTVLGREGDVGLCNAVIFSEPSAPFLVHWLSKYADFSDSQWNYYSVVLPHIISSQLPNDIHIEPKTSFFDPMWDDSGIRELFCKSTRDYSGSIIFHAWEKMSWDSHLKHLSLNDVAYMDGQYHRIAKRFI